LGEPITIFSNLGLQKTDETYTPALSPPTGASENPQILSRDSVIQLNPAEKQNLKTE
jgi:hypothetical protein